MQANKHILFTNIIVWVSPIIDKHKKFAFQRIKIRSIQKAVKKIQKINHKPQQVDFNNYLSITDFKPLVDNYSSIKISEENSQSNFQTNKKINMTELIINQQTFLDQWMIRQKSQVFLMEDFPISTYAEKSISSYSNQALKTVKSYKFSNFCKSTLKKKTNWFFQQVDPLLYKTVPISMSLIHLAQIKIQISLQMFEDLLKAAMDMASEHPPIYHVHKFINTIVSDTQDLREQGYLQVIKQLSSQKKQYLQILACLSATVKPSTRMYLPLLNYIYEKSIENSDFIRYYSYIFYQLIKNFDQPRKHSPSIFQLSCYRKLRKIPIIIYFPKEKVFFIQPYTTVEQLLKQIIQFYHLDTHIQYLLFVKNILLEKGILLDKLNYYWKDLDLTAKRRYINFEGIKSMIVLKNMCDIKNSSRCLNIMYNYFTQQYISGIFVLSPRQMTRISGLMIFSQIAQDENYQFIFQRLVPKQKLQKMQKDRIQTYKKHILKNYFNFKGTRQQAKKQVLKILQKKKGYMTHFFRCYGSLNKQQQIKMWLGIQNNKVVLIQPATGRIMKHIGYNLIQKWGNSKTQLRISIQSIGQYRFQTKATDVLSSILKNYLDFHKKLIQLNQKQKQ